MEHRPDQQPGQRPTVWGGSWSGAPSSAPPGQRRLTPALIAGAITVGIVLAMIVYAVFVRPNNEPDPPPHTPNSSSVQTPTGPTTTRTPHQSSTRTPPPTVTRSEKRADMAPLAAMGEAVEFVDSDGVGLITVVDAQWIPPSAYRQPEEGYEFLGVQVEIESIQGTIDYSPVQGLVQDADAGLYTFIIVSGFTDHPQFDSGELQAGEVMNGWVIFELPKADSTFIWASGVEQATRVTIEGGEPLPPVAPDTVLDKSFTETLYDAEGTIAVEGISWFTESTYETPKPGNEFLAVKVRASAGAKPYYVSPLDFEIELASGTTVSYSWVSSPVYRPGLASVPLVAGEQISGWIIFEVPREDCELIIEGASYGAELGRVAIPS